MEKSVRIQIPKTRLHINGLLRGSWNKPLVVFVHGLTGMMNEHQFYNGARWFERHGFSSLRFELYDYEIDTRKLHACTIQTHANDLDTVVAYARAQGSKRISVVGHSYGGPTILKSRRHDFDRAVLWDPTAVASFRPYGAKFVRSLNVYRLPGAHDFLIGKRMFEENERLDGPGLLERFPVPTLVVTTDQRGSHGKYWKGVNKTSAIHRQVMIRGVTHCFDEDRAEEKLFTQTLQWIKMT